MAQMLKKGARGPSVETLQKNLQKLGYKLAVDGIFGDETHEAVVSLQKAFGYTVDGIVGPGTQELIRAQAAYGWNVQAKDASERAAQAQGKVISPSGQAKSAPKS